LQVQLGGYLSVGLGRCGCRSVRLLCALPTNSKRREQ
jgi:hypothetical protein